MSLSTIFQLYWTKNQNRFVCCCPTDPPKLGLTQFFIIAVATKKKLFPFSIYSKSRFVLFRFDPYFIVTGTCSRFSEVLVYSVQLSGKNIEMIRINQRLLSTCRLLHVSRDNGVGRHLPFVHQLLSNVETKMKIYAKIVCTCLKLMILGMIYSKIYWRKVSLKSIKQTQYQ